MKYHMKDLTGYEHQEIFDFPEACNWLSLWEFIVCIHACTAGKQAPSSLYSEAACSSAKLICVCVSWRYGHNILPWPI
jgi:hypothetical protein